MQALLALALELYEARAEIKKQKKELEGEKLEGQKLEGQELEGQELEGQGLPNTLGAENPITTNIPPLSDTKLSPTEHVESTNELNALPNAGGAGGAEAGAGLGAEAGAGLGAAAEVLAPAAVVAAPLAGS